MAMSRLSATIDALLGAAVNDPHIPEPDQSSNCCTGRTWNFTGMADEACIHCTDTEHRKLELPLNIHIHPERDEKMHIC